MTALYTDFRRNLSQDIIENNTSGLVTKVNRRKYTSNITKTEWQDVYAKQIMHMYDIMADLVDSRYSHNITWKHNKTVLDALTTLIYKSSFKYISPYDRE
jgi:hypothetical protein